MGGGLHHRPTGYQEILTDPSHCGQLVTLTYPHIGNTGTNAEDQGIEQDLCGGADRSRSADAGVQLAHERNAAAVFGAQWRGGHCRSGYATAHASSSRKGAQNGCIVTGSHNSAVGMHAHERAQTAPSMAGLDLAKVVSCASPYEWSQSTWTLGAGYGVLQNPRFHVVAYDFGVKHNILRMLAERSCKLTVVPAQTPAEAVLAMKPDGVFLSTARATRNPAITPFARFNKSSRQRCRCSASAWVTNCSLWPGCQNDEDEIRPSWEPIIRFRIWTRAGLYHQPEPWVCGG